MKHKTIAVFGPHGLLGSHVRALVSARYDVVEASANILNEEDVISVVNIIRPDIVVNCAAFTHIDEAEREPLKAMEVNAMGAGIVAKATRGVGATLVHYSSDSVFDAMDGVHTELSSPRARGAYSFSKLAGEETAKRVCPKTIIVRTANLFGFGGHNNASTMASKLASGGTVYADPDRYVSPTWAKAVVDRTIDLLDYGFTHGTFHAVSSGQPTTWYQFACQMLEIIGRGAVEPRTVSGPAPRPKHCIIVDRITPLAIKKMPTWGSSQRNYLHSEGFL